MMKMKELYVSDIDQRYNKKLNTEIPSFSEDVISLCEQKGINTGAEFERCTYLSRNIFTRLKNKKNYVPDENAAYTICIALGLTVGESCELLRKARYSIIPYNGNDIYRELLVKMLANNYMYIPDCNKLLRKYGCKELGSIKI